VIAAVVARGFGANVVSRGEWALARRAGVPNDRISLEGIGKTPADLRAAVRAAKDGSAVAWVALESVDEAAALAELARRAGAPPIDVLYRVNPDVAPETLAELAVGAGGSKFGMTESEIGAAIEAGGGPDGALRPRGIHLHVGSQLGAVDAWREAVRKALALAALWRGSIETFDTVDLGGGFPVRPQGEPSPTPERFARELPALLDAIPADRRPTRLAIEPGRALVARAGWLLARVLHVRERGGRQVILDAGMTELIRPALYGAIHPIHALTSRPGPTEPTRVEGPICESTDSLGTHDLPPLRRGDLVAIADAGAYATSLGSTYNGRPRPPQVLLGTDGALSLFRRRGAV
jgi:diaminopimelate decarboxylase